jgi:Ser-tRNA(Ala) deacylase AlaX
MQYFPVIPILQNIEHSVRLYETLNLSILNTKVVALAEQIIKIKQNDDFVMIDTLGIVLEKTILHPQGGGQPSDQGHINQIPVLSVKEDKQTLSKTSIPTIYHFVDKTLLSKDHTIIYPGQEIRIALNLDTRLIHTRFHSAGHLIADIVEQEPVFASLSAKAISGHHFPNEAYIKVLINSNVKNRDEFIDLLNKSLFEKIERNLSTASYYKDGIRHIKIGDSSRKCGGTHVAFTGEIQSCVIKKIKISEPPLKNSDPFELTLFYTC